MLENFVVQSSELEDDEVKCCEWVNRVEIRNYFKDHDSEQDRYNWGLQVWHFFLILIKLC
jgi:hypothetical protein